MNAINFSNKKQEKETIPHKIKHFLFSEDDENLYKQVEEYNNFATYNLESDISTRSILNGLKDVNNMMDDPICSAAVKCVMQTAFQTNADNKLFKLTSGSSLIENELNSFHEQINADNVLLITGFNDLLWGQLPWKHIFNEDGIMDRVVPIPDFTAVTPVIISGKTIGFIDENGDYVPSYMYTYSQYEYYKNLGGNSSNKYITYGTGDAQNQLFKNEFTYANSYLGSASKPWRNVNIIEDGLLLNRMDQSNYYRIISVNVGGQVYSKSAIQTLNYYRNLFKKVRRVNYDSNGMASRGNGQSFEVIVPQTQNQGVSIQNVGGELDIKALRDLDIQYNKLFAALQIQPSMIGFSSDTPSSLGDSAAVSWDKRFAKVCKTISFSAYNTLRNMDYIHLRSLGYNVNYDDWKYATVSQTLQEDVDKGETLEKAIKNLDEVTKTLSQMQAEYDKDYLIKSMLADAFANYGIDVEKLLTTEESQDTEQVITTSFKKDILSADAKIMVSSGMFKKEEADEIVQAYTNENFDKLNIKESITPITLKQVYSSFVVRKDNPLNLENFVVYEDKDSNEMTSMFNDFKKIKNGVGIDFNFPIHCSKEFEITAGDLDSVTNNYIESLYVDENNVHYVTSKKDLCAYLYNFMNGGLDNYCASAFFKK